MAEAPFIMRGKIGVWGHFHGGNIGDDIVVATLIANIRQRLPGHQIHGFSLEPSDTAQRHGIPSSAIKGGPVFPAPDRPPAANTPPVASSEETPASPAPKVREARRRTKGRGAASKLVRAAAANLRMAGRLSKDLAAAPAIWRRLRECDAVFVAGSGPVFDDMGGTWAHPYNLLRWALLSRLAGTKFCLLNVGAGPIRHELSRKFLARALRLSHYHSFRDESSVDLARSLGNDKPTPLYCDMAFAVPESEIRTANEHALVGRRPRIGIAPMAYMDSSYWHNSDSSIGGRYLDALAELSHWLLTEGYDLVLLKSQRVADARTAARLLEKLSLRGIPLDDGRIYNPETRGHQDLLRQMACCELVVGGRFHCHVLPFVLGIPVLGISYHPKTDELMRQMGQQEYFVRMDEVTGDVLIRLFEKMWQDRSEIIAVIENHSKQHREVLRRQFDELFAPAFIG